MGECESRLGEGGELSIAGTGLYVFYSRYGLYIHTMDTYGVTAYLSPSYVYCMSDCLMEQKNKTPPAKHLYYLYTSTSRHTSIIDLRVPDLVVQSKTVPKF